MYFQFLNYNLVNNGGVPLCHSQANKIVAHCKMLWLCRENEPALFLRSKTKKCPVES